MDKYENYSPEIPYTDDLNPQDPDLQREDRINEQRTNKKTSKGDSRKKRPVKSPELKKKKQELEAGSKVLAERLKAFFTAQNFRMIIGMIAGGLGCWLLIAFFSYVANCIADQSLINNSPIGEAPPVGNSAGEGGARLSEFLINESFGLGSLVIVFWLLAMAMKLLIGWPKFKSVNFTIKCLVALITVSLIVGLATIAIDTPVNWGGFHGRYVNEFVVKFVGWSGAGILSLVMVGIFVLICLSDLVNWIIRLKRKHDARKKAEAELRAEQARRDAELEQMRVREAQDAAKAGEGEDLKIERENIYDGTPMSFDMPEGSDSYKLPDLDEYYDKSAPISQSNESDKKDLSANSPIYDANENCNYGAENVAEVKGVQSTAGSYNTNPSPDSIRSDSESEFSSSVLNTISSKSGNDRSSEGPADGNESAEYRDSESPVEKVALPENDSEAGYDKGSEESLPEEKAAMVTPMVVNVNQVAEANKLQASAASNLYEFPPIELLRKGIQKISVDANEQMENKEKIRKTLLDFDIPIVSIEATVGPTITLYEIRPERGVKISKIRSLVDDIALSLSAIGVRIIAPIPGRGTVGIEVANKDPQTVSMRTIITSQKYQQSHAKLPVAIGSTIANDVYIADLAKMPHLLVAGATGQGKSVGLNAIIASLLYCKKPNELKFVMIDPKQVEFSLYSKIEKHYLAKLPETDDAIITDMSCVVETLNALCVEMGERYQKLKQAEVRNLEEYNEKVEKGLLPYGEDHHFLPYIVLVVDEFADLIMTAGKDVEMPIARLAQKARAVGMHVIIATQRPSTNVITGIIKANFPVRIAFKVSSGIDSKTILDTPGAQLLIGRGDMLISNNSEMVRVQCAFIDTPEVDAICHHIANQPGGGGAYILPEPPTTGSDGGSGGDSDFSGGLDPLFEECARLVVLNNTASTSSLQRRYSIGYNRAGKIMDQLERAGIVGPSTGGKPRNVLTDQIGLEAILEQYIKNYN